LKALATDIRRNLEMPIAEMQAAGAGREPDRRHAAKPPAAPARAAAGSADDHAGIAGAAALLSRCGRSFFASLKCLIVDELHSFATSKRGHHLALCLARVASLAPHVRFVGLSATVANPPEMADFLAVKDEVEIVQGEPGAQADGGRSSTPRSGCVGRPHGPSRGCPRSTTIIRQHKTSIVFVNTRAQAELVFDRLWRLNEDNLPIGLHHGSLAVEQRRKVEAAMAAGKLRAVIATSSLDLGIDWGDVRPG